MLSKLMKHELRATGRIMLPLFLLVIVSSALANISTRFFMESDHDFLNLLGILLLTVFVLAIMAMCVMAFVLMIQRFYKSLLQDEGYVMMTLPVSVHQHVWSKLLTSLLWYIGAAAVSALAIVILVFDIDFVKQITRFFGDLVEMLPKLDMDALHIVVFAFEMLLFLLVGAAASCLLFYAALSIGHSFPNHKLLLSVAFYFGIQFGMQFVFGALTLLLSTLEPLPMFASFDEASIYIHVVMLALTLGTALVGALFYFLCTYFLKNRINLD